MEVKLTDADRMELPVGARGDLTVSAVERIVAAHLAAVEAYRQRCANTRTEPTLAGLTTALRAAVAADPADTGR